LHLARRATRMNAANRHVRKTAARLRSRMSVSSYFSNNYATARERFRAEVRAAGLYLEVHENPVRGPHGERLTTDVALFGPRDAERLLVLVAGTHGVEGFCGSGILVGLLANGLPGICHRTRAPCWSMRSIPTASPGCAGSTRTTSTSTATSSTAPGRCRPTGVTTSWPMRSAPGSGARPHLPLRNARSIPIASATGR
jgi:hypothetical protein